jgi:uncharacterized protein YodC (DUF2158 family)
VKFVKIENSGLGGLVYEFHCPGCGYDHFVRVKGDGPKWTVSGVDEDRPTVSPSIRVMGQYQCHSFVRDGRIQFLGDCDHSLAGKTIDIPDFDEV